MYINRQFNTYVLSPKYILIIFERACACKSKRSDKSVHTLKMILIKMTKTLFAGASPAHVLFPVQN
jgi:hypothetical protein